MLVYDKNIFGSNREIDSNGYLRVDSCNITKTQVAPYLGREIPGWKDMGLESEKIYYVLRPEEELKKAASTFNNLPLTRKHIEIDVDDVPKNEIVGSLGDHTEFSNGYLKNNLIIYDKKDIDLVMSGKKKELSCGYRYTPVQESGEWNGQHYDFRMTDIVGNHVALVKEGRAGHDVVVSDTIEAIKEKIMNIFKKKTIVEDEFVESEHPRAKNGQFKSKGGSSSYPFEEVDKVLYPDDKERWEKNKKDFYERQTESQKENEEYEKRAEKAKKEFKDDFDVASPEQFKELTGLTPAEFEKKYPVKENKTESQKEAYAAHKKIGEELIERAAGIEDFVKRGQANKELEALEKLDGRVLTSGELSDEEIDEYHQAYLRAKDYVVSKNTDNSWNDEDLDDETAGKYTEAKKYLRKAENARNLGNHKEAEEFEKKADELSGIKSGSESKKEEKSNLDFTKEDVMGFVKKLPKEGISKKDAEKLSDKELAMFVAAETRVNADRSWADSIENAQLQMENGREEVIKRFFSKDPEGSLEEMVAKSIIGDVKFSDKEEKKVEDEDIPSKDGNAEKDGENSPENGEKKMEENKELIVKDKDLEGKEKESFAEGVKFGEEKEKEEPKKLDSEHESEGTKKADEKKAEEKKEAEDEDKKEDKKEAEDKCAKDKCVKDEKPAEMAMDIDAIKEQVRQEVMNDFKAREEARKSVRSIVGDVNVFAFDSAEEIYKFACEKAGMDLDEIASYKSAFKGLCAAKGMRKMAMDASSVGSNKECLENIRVE